MKWMQRRKLKRMLKGIRNVEIDLVDSYMDKVYNPRVIVSKPKYRNREENAYEEEVARRYVHMIYDPPILAKHKRDHSLNEYMKGEA